MVGDDIDTKTNFCSITARRGQKPVARMGQILANLDSSIRGTLFAWDEPKAQRAVQRLSQFEKDEDRTWLRREEFFSLTRDESAILEGKFLDLHVESV